MTISWMRRRPFEGRHLLVELVNILGLLSMHLWFCETYLVICLQVVVFCETYLLICLQVEMRAVLKYRVNKFLSV